MATSEQYAEWIVKNKDKKGTPDFEKVAEAYKLSMSQLVEQPKPQEPEGFTERVSADLEKRLKSGVQTGKEFLGGELSLQEAMLQEGGAVAGAALDIAGEGLASAGRGIKEITPEPVQKAVGAGFESLINALPFKDEAVDALSGGMEGWNTFSESNPRIAKDIESVVNIGMILSPVKVKAKAKPTMLSDAAKSLDSTIKRQILKKRSDFVGDLITPERTKKVLIDETSRTAEKGRGVFKRSVVELSKREKEIASEVSKINNVTPKNSFQGNLNAISQENTKLAKKLDKAVGNRKVLGIHNKANKKIDEAISLMIAENPVITGNTEIVANKIAVKAKQIIAKSPDTPKGVLDARKELDSWIKSQKGEKAFNPELEGALSLAVRSVRGALNDTVEASAGASVKKSLKKQSLLYSAMDNLGPKAAAEANNAIGRLVQNMAQILPFRSRFVNEVGTVMGLGVVGSSTLLAPYFAGGLGTTVVGRGIYKAAISPKVKQALSKLLKETDNAIKASKDGSMIQQLRADKAVIRELVKTAEVDNDIDNQVEDDSEARSLGRNDTGTSRSIIRY
jgi:hypothetical protein